MKENKHTKKSAGQMGGRATLALYGPDHMREIGKRGAAITWARYHLTPLGQNNFAMVDKQTGIVKATLIPWRE